MKLSHYAIATSKIEECILFYQSFCAMRIVKDRHDGPTRVVWLAPLEQEDFILVFVSIDGVEYANRASDSMLRHLGFELESREAVDRVHKALLSSNHECTNPVDVDEITGYVFMARDPEGRWVEFSFGQDTSPEAWD